MKRALLVAPALGVAVALAITTPSAVAANLCVGPHHPCFATLAAAVKAARRGDTIKLGPGTFTGGVTIPVSINIAGAGSGRTRIRGGGPVLTIGTVDSVHEPTVSISRVTITGGRTKGDGTKAVGGGIFIPAGGGGNGPGANVTITDSVISGNDVEPTVAAPLGPPCPGGKTCPYAGAYGGGIDNSGTLKLERTTIRGNQVGGPVASDADGAGIDSDAGSVTLVDCLVTSNRATAVAPNGRFADSGGIFAEGGTLTITGSSVRNNSATLHAAMPNSVETGAVAGGIHIADHARGSITDSTVSGNSVTMTNSVGDANAASGGVHADASLVLSNDTITNNSVTASALGHAGGNASDDSGAGEWAGKLTYLGSSAHCKRW